MQHLTHNGIQTSTSHSKHVNIALKTHFLKRGDTVAGEIGFSSEELCRITEKSFLNSGKHYIFACAFYYVVSSG